MINSAETLVKSILTLNFSESFPHDVSTVADNMRNEPGTVDIINHLQSSAILS